jgi:hypothetical protein
MSGGAKEVIIKFVAQAIPTYIMGVFKLLANLCEELTQIIQYFWWGEEGGPCKIHWIAWDKLLMPKCAGGIGFRDMKLFNQALLARRAWRLLKFPESLCARTLKAKYYPRGDLVDIVFSREASPTWRLIEHGLALLKKGVIWSIKSGNKVQIWRDPWIPSPPSFKIMMRKGRSRLRWVLQLMKPGRREWDE